MHETRSHEASCFITLTYDDQNLPQDEGLVLGHFQKFMKRLRKHAGKTGLKYFHCGEYGDQLKRPHYHALIYGYEPNDRKLFSMSNDIPVYSSATLDAIWGMGFTSVGAITFQSAAYVARYALKKVNGKQAEQINEVTGLKHYERINPITLQITEVSPEYATMSRNPGIGKDFFDNYRSDIYPWDEVVINGVSTKPPRYYDKLFEQINPESMENIRISRQTKMEKYRDDNTRARLATKEIVKKAQTSKLKRNEAIL